MTAEKKRGKELTESAKKQRIIELTRILNEKYKFISVSKKHNG